MVHTPGSGTLFYRVTEQDRSWPDVLSGTGAYFSVGGRYNRIHQKTVYAAEDPLVSIAEAAFHRAIYLQNVIGGGPLSEGPVNPPDLPLRSDHLLWCFTLGIAPRLVDVEDPVALQTFRHRPYELLNPSSQDYHRTAMLADLIRNHCIRHHPIPGGILAPSVRTPDSPGYTPRQHIFFVPHDVLALPGTQVLRWTLTIEFRDTAGQSVTHSTRDIDWSRPWVRLGGARRPVPAYTQRPGAHPFKPGTWYQIAVKFA
jgi:RES domain